MSWAPRPRTSPSTTSPAHGLKLHSEASAGTVSTWPSRHRVGAVAPRRRGRRRGSGARARRRAACTSKPASPQALGEQLLGAVLVAGRVDGVERDQLAEQVDRPGSEVGFGKRRLLAHAPRLLPRHVPRLRHCPRMNDASSTPATPRRRRTHAGAGRRGAAGGADAPARARRADRPGAPARPRARPCGPRSRPASRTRWSSTGRRAPARRRSRGSSPAPRAARSRRSRRSTPAGPRSRAMIERADRAPPRHRPADDLLPRRDPPLQQGPAGRAAARRSRRAW